MTDRQLESIRAVVRGVHHWSELANEGLAVSRCDRVWTFGPLQGEPVRTSCADVVEGMRAHVGSPTDLREWAEFMLAASGLIELDESGAEAAKVLECLWDLSEGSMGSARTLLGEPQGARGVGPSGREGRDAR